MVLINKGNEHPEEFEHPDRPPILVDERTPFKLSRNDFIHFVWKEKRKQRNVDVSYYEGKLEQRDTAWIKALLKEGIMVAEPEQLKGIRERLAEQVRAEVLKEAKAAMKQCIAMRPDYQEAMKWFDKALKSGTMPDEDKRNTKADPEPGME